MSALKFPLVGRLRRLTASKTVFDLSTMMSGTVAAAVIPLIFSPVLSRIFLQADYGILGLFTSVSAVFGVLIYSHYSHAIMLERDDNTARQAVWFTCVLTAAASLLLLFILVALIKFTIWFEGSALGLWYLLIPLTLFLSGIISSLSVWLNRLKAYKPLAGSRIVQAIVTALTQLGIGLWMHSESGLIVGLVAGQLLACIVLGVSCLKTEKLRLGKPHTREFKPLALRHINLLYYSTPSDLINGLINQAPVFLLQSFAGISAVGSFTFAQRILGVPNILLSSSITEIFKQKISAAYAAQGDCRRIFIKTFHGLTFLGILPFLVLLIWGPDLIVFVFGPQWSQAGEFSRYLAILYFFRFVISPLTYVYYVAGRLQENFLLHVIFLLASVASFVFANYYLEDPALLVLSYAVTYSFIYLIYLLRSFKLSIR